MSTFDEQFEKFMHEPLSSESVTKNSSGKVSSPLEVKAAPTKPKDLWWVKNSSKRFGETSRPEPKDAGNYISSKSPACSDVASSLAEFLQKEKMCKEQNGSKGMTPASGGGDLTDDDLSSIKEQPSVGDCTEKSVEEILKEYEEMQQNSVLWKPYVEMVADHSNHSEKNNSMNSGDGGGEKSIEEIFKEYEEEQQKNEESWRHYCEMMSGHSTLSGENSSNSSNKLSGTGSVSEKTMEDIIKEFNEVSQQNAERMKKICVDQREPKNGKLKPPVKRRKDLKAFRHANVDGSFPASDGQDSVLGPTEYQNRRLSSSLANHSDCSTSEESDKVVGNISSGDIPIAPQATDTFPVNSKNNKDTVRNLPFSVSLNEMDLNQLKMSKKVNDSKTSLPNMCNVENVALKQLIDELLPSEVARLEEQLPIDENYNTDSEVLSAQGVDLGVVGSAGSVEVNADTPDERDVLSTVIEESSVETSVEESKRGEVKGAAGEISVSSTELNRIKSLEWELAQEQKKVFDLKCTLETKENEFAKQRKILKQKYEMQIFELQKDIRILKAQIEELEAEGTRQKAAKDGIGEEQRIALLEKELQQQEQLILGCQRENLRLCQDIRQAKQV